MTIRRLFTAASVLSLLLCAATIVLWVWSYRLTDRILCQNRFGLLSIHAVPGGIIWDKKVGIEHNYFGFGYWQIVLLTLVLPLWPLVRRCGQSEARRRQTVKRRLEAMSRFPDGLRRSCGYDLRASKDRCPECGTPTPVGWEPSK